MSETPSSSEGSGPVVTLLPGNQFMMGMPYPGTPGTPYFDGHNTYSQLFTKKIKDNTSNRIALFQRPAKIWFEIRKGKTSWTHDDWHAFAIGWIQKPNVTFSKDLVIFDVECRTPDEVGKLTVASLPIVKGFIDYCRNGKLKRKINNIWYSQDIKHREKEDCLKHSLEWLKKFKLIGDQKLSNIDWESMGFKKIGV